MTTCRRLPLNRCGPSAQQIADARITDFARHVRRPDDDYDALWNWSVTDLPGFWAAIWGYFGLDAASDYDEVLADPTMPGAQWFTGATVNFAEHLLNQGEPGDVALVVADESGQSTSWTRERLRDEAGPSRPRSKRPVSAGATSSSDISRIAETIVAFAATASLGAIWSGVGRDYVADAAIDRFGQLEPKVLITSTGYHFNGKQHERRADVVRLRDGLPTVTTTIVVERLGFDGEGWASWSRRGRDPSRVRPGPRAVRPSAVGALLVRHHRRTEGPGPRARRNPRRDAQAVGPALGSARRRPGVLVHLAELDDVERADLALALGASVICYDGSPTFPDAAAMWDLVDEHEVTFFGTSPGYLLASQTAGVTPDQRVAHAGAAACDGQHRIAAVARHPPLAGAAASRRPPVVDLRRYRRMQRVHRRRPDGPGVAGRAVGAVPGVGGGVLGSRRRRERSERAEW